MASYKKKNDFEYNNGNNKIPDSFNFSSDGTNNPYSEDFVFHFEDNKISATNDVGFTGLEENDESASNAKAKKLELDENNNNNNEPTSESEAASESSAASSSSASSSASASSSSTATATASITSLPTALASASLPNSTTSKGKTHL